MIVVQTDEQLVDHIKHLYEMAKMRQAGWINMKGVKQTDRAKNDEAVFQLGEMVKLVELHKEQAKGRTIRVGTRDKA